MLKKSPLFIKLFLLATISYALFIVAGSCFSEPTSMSGKNMTGEKLFKANCSGCHLNGQNLIKPDKPVVGSAKLKSKQFFSTFLESPPPPMPNFKNIAAENEQLSALYNYVSSLMGN